MPGNRHPGMANGPLDMPGETNLNQHSWRDNGTEPFAAFAIILWRPYPGCLLGADGYQMSEPVVALQNRYVLRMPHFLDLFLWRQSALTACVLGDDSAVGCFH